MLFTWGKQVQNPHRGKQCYGSNAGQFYSGPVLTFWKNLTNLTNVLQCPDQRKYLSSTSFTLDQILIFSVKVGHFFSNDAVPEGLTIALTDFTSIFYCRVAWFLLLAAQI